MDAFQALAEPTRRSIVELLAQKGQLAATDIAERFDSSVPAISQHLKLLRETHILLVQKQAQKRVYSINTKTILKLEIWADRIQVLWSQRTPKEGSPSQKKHRSLT